MPNSDSDADGQMSRRKQSRPAKRNAPSPSGDEEEASVSTVSDDDSEMSLGDPKVRDKEAAIRSTRFPVIPKGCSFGPFSAVRLDDSLADDPPDCISFRHGEKNQRFAVKDDIWRQWLKHLKMQSSKDEKPNCIVEANGTEIRIQTTENLHSLDDLVGTLSLKREKENGSPENCLSIHIPEKKMVCSHCQTAFSSKSTLDAHQTYYCIRQDRKISPGEKRLRTEERREESGGSGRMVGPFYNALLVPVAFHSRPDASGVQVLGHPQVIIPVAIPKSPDALLPHKPVLLLEDAWSHGVKIPAHLPIGQTETEFSLQLLLRSNAANAIPVPAINKPKAAPKSDPEPLDLTMKESSGSVLKRKAISPDSKSKKIASDKVSVAVTSKKVYNCEFCGIKFTSPKTLQGHQQYYCRSAEKSGDEEVGGVTDGACASSSESRAAFPCQQCDFTAASSGQLSVHVRSAHDTVHSFLCQLCGYIGYSARGMKSHLRTHMDLTTHNLQELASNSADSDRPRSSDSIHKPLPPPAILCQMCQTAFPDLQSYSRHSCPGDVGLESHRRTRQHNESDTVGNYNCKFCPYKSPYKGNVKRHLSLVHKMDSSAKEDGQH